MSDSVSLLHAAELVEGRRPSTAWRRLNRNRTVKFGVWGIGLLLALAVFAPAIALHEPFIWRSADGISSPWLRALFNRLLFENSIDIFFNLLLVVSPLAALGTWLGPRLWNSVSRRRQAVLAITAFLIAFSAIAHPGLGEWRNPLRLSERVVNHRKLVEQLNTDSPADRPWVVFPPLPFSYRETSLSESLKAPSERHWLGTDKEGRDVFARMLYGTRISLTIGVVAVLLYVGIGVFLGALAGYYGGWVDSIISRLIEVMVTFPSFFLILTLAAMIEERSIFHVMAIIGLTRWTSVARLVRAEFLRQRQLEYVHAATATGLPTARIIFGHILPNAISPALVSATFGVASAILIESSLSFLGVGDTSVASWGATLNTGRIEKKLWLVLAPGGAIFLVVTLFNLVGEGVRDALDPKLRT